MVPETEIRFSWVYNKKLNPEINPSEFVELKEKCGGFIDLYEKYIVRILKSIEKNNEIWRRKFIPIYVVFAKTKSFSDPLTIKYRKDHKLMMLILIHELVHNNLVKKYENPSMAHAEVDRVFEAVLVDLELGGFEEAINKMHNLRANK